MPAVHLLQRVADLTDRALARAAATPRVSRLPSPEDAAFVNASSATRTASGVALGPQALQPPDLPGAHR